MREEWTVIVYKLKRMMLVIWIHQRKLKKVSGPLVINFQVPVKALAADNGITDDLKARKSSVEKEQNFLEAEDLVVS